MVLSEVPFRSKNTAKECRTRWDDPLPGIATPLRRAQTRNAVEIAVVLRGPIGAFTRRKICRNGGGRGTFLRYLCSARPTPPGKGRSRADPVCLWGMEILPARH